MMRSMGWVVVTAILVSGVLVRSSATAAKPLTPADVRVKGMTIALPQTGQTLTIEPLAVVHRTATGDLKVEQPTWRNGTGLPGTGWIFRSLRPGSLTVTRADQPGVKLAEGIDYVVDHDWARLGAVEGSIVPPGTPLKFEYAYTLSRLDLIQRAPDGRYSVVAGKPDRSQPLLPPVEAGHVPILGVYLPPNTTALTEANLNFIDPSATGVPEVTGRHHIGPAVAKLAAGRPTTIVFFGDSITVQQPRDFRDGKGSFVDRFATYLRGRYGDREVIETGPGDFVPPTGSQIVVVKSGRGGDDTPRGMARLKSEVLDKDPDLVIILFGANDENRRGASDRNMVPAADYEANLAAMVAQIQQAGGSVILMTPAMKNLQWSSTVGNMDDYAEAVRRVGAKAGACVVDNFKAWKALPKIGYNYMIYLGTCINHPVDLGHELFFQGVKSAVEGRH